jgi:hypothetical protein
MKSPLEKLTNIEFDHRLWLNELAFYFKEMAIYEDRILELLEIYKDETTEKELEKILLGIAQQKEKVEQIQEQIRDHIIHINEKVQGNGELKAIVDTVHHKTREDMEMLRKTFDQLKDTIHRLPVFRD